MPMINTVIGPTDGVFHVADDDVDPFEKLTCFRVFAAAGDKCPVMMAFLSKAVETGKAIREYDSCWSEVMF